MYYVSPSKRAPYDRSKAFVTIDAAMTYAELVSRLKRPDTVGVTESYDVWEPHATKHDRHVRAVATDGVSRWQKACEHGPCCFCADKGYVDDERGSR